MSQRLVPVPVIVQPVPYYVPVPVPVAPTYNAPQDVPSQITFMLNGQQVIVANPDPKVTLNDYLRSQPKTMGTKVSCAEGGCGACTVMMQSTSPLTGKTEYLAINSCLRPLCSMNGLSVVTVEGIGSSRAGFHPIQQRIADNNGTQCGYCTPGWVMNMYSLLQNNPNPTVSDIEDNFDGNLCRCTGYRPILESLKTFGTDYTPTQKSCDTNTGTCCSKHFYPDIEELGIQFEKCNLTPTKKQAPMYVRPLYTTASNVQWFTPLTLPDLYSVLNQYPQSGVTKLVVGNTSSGVFKEDSPTVLISVENIPDLKQVSQDSTGLTIGAAITINDVISLVEATNLSSLQSILAHLKRVANTQVRNVGSWAGNIMMVKTHADFPSDVYTCFLTLGATLSIGTSNGVTNNVDLISFLSYNMTSAAILSVRIPFPQQNEIVNSFKVAIRKVNAHSILNAGLRTQVDPNTFTVLSQPSLVYGGVSQYTTRMSKTEQYLVGKVLTNPSTLTNALTILSQEAVFSPGPGKIAYRTSLLTSLFYKLYLLLLPANAIKPELESAVTQFVRPVSSGIQSFQTDPSEYPVSQPIPKLKGRMQASGEVRYTGDIPTPDDTVFGAFVLSTAASATISNIDATQALAAPGVIAFYSAKDIPGSNNWSMSEPEEIFANTQVNYYGQAIGFIVADTQRHANDAAKLVNVTYTNQQTPILTIEDAIAQNSIFPPYANNPTGSPVVSGNIAQGFAQSQNIISGSVSVGAQYHFHMETQTVLVLPDREGPGNTPSFEVKSATQWTTAVQLIISQALGLPASAINVGVHAIGGGFGGKITKPCQVAAAAAIASYKLDRPVKAVVDLNTNMEMIGIRNPILCQYKVGFSNTGVLQALQYNLYADGGAYPDTSPGTIMAALYCIDNNYYVPNFSATGVVCRTNLPSNTAMRGPGWVPSILFAEHVINHVATSLNMDVTDVQEANFYKGGQATPYGMTLANYNLPTMWESMKVSSEYLTRKAAVDAFNATSRWVKRGISLNNVKFGIGWAGNQFGVVINIYGDGTVSVTHSGTEIGQGIDTKVAQVTALELGIPLSMIVVQGTSTQANPNTSATGGSITSGLNSLAVIQACKAINTKLAPFKEKIPNPTWNALVSAAIGAGIDLQEKGWVAPTAPTAYGGPWDYNSYVVACTEVELDVLTGEIEIIRADILFDCGISLNPAIDIGQVEGAFIQGLGYYLTEQMLNDQTTGQLLTNGTWEYKPPSTKDIPIDFRVTLLKNAPNPIGILNSKGSGEPPLAAACSGFFAVKQAVTQARAAAGLTGYFPMDAPATVENAQISASVASNQFCM